MDEHITLPLNSSKVASRPPPSAANNNINAAARAGLNNASQDSQVLHDTLNVIDEHITDLRSTPSQGALHPAVTDSGSEYSAPVDSRMSYIQGEETDEEEEAGHSRAEVESWSPDNVAEYLFTVGVEKHHCEVFADQEISGEVLLGMDQNSLFIKDFDLGSVGRRLKTWHKIKALQDEVGGPGRSPGPSTQAYGSDAGIDEARRPKSRTSTLTGSISNHPAYSQTRRLSSHTPRTPTFASINSPALYPDSPSRPNHAKRPSAASVRDLHHSRRHSTNDPHLSNPATPRLSIQGGTLGPGGAHKKQPSFDRNWTLGGAYSQSSQPRPLSSAGLKQVATAPDSDLQDSAVDLDRGYFSGTDADGRKRNVLKKREIAGSSRSSYAEEQRVRSATALSRHSRFGSYDSFRDGSPSLAAQKYYGLQPGSHKRTASANTTESMRPVPPAKDAPSPSVTKLDEFERPRPLTKHSHFTPDWLSLGKQGGKGMLGWRAGSENNAKPRISLEPTPKDNSIDSSGRTGSSTASVGHSLEAESPEAGKTFGVIATPLMNRGRKGKKGTSAYTRGLQKIAPSEAMKDADYSGWMRKKSSNLMTMWKPRLFVLKGRRLAYYYSEDDQEEKGLIDISFHRVLPADNERLTGLHATITGVVGPHNMPSHADEGAGNLDKGDDSMFIFKLVPPRAGLSRAVTFTKPTVHYFAVPNLKQGRLWMAAMMKATIERDNMETVTTTYQQKTISLEKARKMRHRPPALMNLDEATEDEQKEEQKEEVENGLGILGQVDGGASEVNKPDTHPLESPKLKLDF